MAKYFVVKKDNHDILFIHEGSPSDISWNVPHVILPADQFEKPEDVDVWFDGKEYSLELKEELKPQVGFFAKLFGGK